MVEPARREAELAEKLVGLSAELTDERDVLGERAAHDEAQYLATAVGPEQTICTRAEYEVGVGQLVVCQSVRRQRVADQSVLGERVANEPVIGNDSRGDLADRWLL